MRFWNRLKVTPARSGHSRSTQVRATSLTNNTFGQRPMFSRPDDEDVQPATGELPFETMLDFIVPSDESEGNADSPIAIDPTTQLVAKYSGANVGSTPTDSEINSVMGANNKKKGFIGVIADSGGNPMYVVSSNGTDWYYVRMTKAV